MATHVVNVPRCLLDEITLDPPAGHRGCYLTPTLPPWAVGDTIRFTVFCREVVAEAVVVRIEPPEENSRPDLYEKGKSRYKTHWKPATEAGTPSAKYAEVT